MPLAGFSRLAARASNRAQQDRQLAFATQAERRAMVRAAVERQIERNRQKSAQETAERKKNQAIATAIGVGAVTGGIGGLIAAPAAAGATGLLGTTTALGSMGAGAALGAGTAAASAFGAPGPLEVVEGATSLSGLIQEVDYKRQANPLALEGAAARNAGQLTANEAAQVQLQHNRVMNPLQQTRAEQINDLGPGQFEQQRLQNELLRQETEPVFLPGFEDEDNVGADAFGASPFSPFSGRSVFGRSLADVRNRRLA